MRLGLNAIDEASKGRCREGLAAAGLFSAAINVLALTGAIYMLQVYDRVLPARHIPTLVGLTVLMVGLYVAFGLLDHLRSRLMCRIGVEVDAALRDKVFAALQLLPLRGRQSGDGQQPVRDLDQVRGFMSGLGPTALFDLPWVPLYLFAVHLLHPALGLFALSGAVLLVALTVLTEVRSAAPLMATARSAGRRLSFGEAVRRNAEVIRAMGLGPEVGRRWSEMSRSHLDDQLQAADAAGSINAVAKVLLLLLQSGMLGLGAYYAVLGELSSGSIIAATIIMSRALAPVEISIAHWRGFVSARQSWRRLSELLATCAEESRSVDLPGPSKSLTVESLAVVPPGEVMPVLQGVTFSLEAGDALGIVGPSASGKSSLARALVGAWTRIGGAIRLDGATLDQWSPEALGRHIGYLPQDIELFDGTIAENISRLEADADSDAIVAAARAAGVHDMIVHLPRGYETRVGEGGASLSAGQRQRIGLARALYREPFLVVLDEPNSNLDHAGDAALSEAIVRVRQRGGIVLVVAHRPSALAGIDTVLALAGGRVRAIGSKDDMLRSMVQAAPQPMIAPASPTRRELPQGLSLALKLASGGTGAPK
jgi:ATP-binding cassette subfamily C protein